MKTFEEAYEEASAIGLCQSRANCEAIWSAASSTLALGGWVAELGVHRGASAKLICGAIGRRPFILFDTFSGMPETDAEVDVHKKGDFGDCSVDAVSQSLYGEPVILGKGVFPETARSYGGTRFSFVHLDADIYRSTLDGLAFFWPRMLPGGMLISHDYELESCPGVKKAFDEYFQPINQSVFRLSERQVLVVKP